MTTIGLRRALAATAPFHARRDLVLQLVDALTFTVSAPVDSGH